MLHGIGHPAPKKRPTDGPGLRLRRREYEDLREAAEAGSTQARVRLSGARKALRRQEEEHARRLKRVH